MNILKSIFILFGGAAALLRLAAETPLVDIDFSRMGGNREIQAKGSFSGPLPGTVRPDFPGWNSSRATTKFQKTPAGNNLRFESQQLDFHILYALSNQREIPFPGYYRITVRYRLGGDSKIWLRSPLSPTYSRYAIVDLPYSADWTTLSIPVAALDEIAGALPKSFEPKGKLQAMLEGGNRPIEISSIQVSRTEMEDYAAFLNRNLKRPPAEIHNYLASSCFPLGLPGGWRGVNVDFPADEPSPSGYPPLRMKEGKAYFFSAPFLAPQGVTRCTLSFQCKGKGTLHVYIMNEKEKPLKADAGTFPLSAAWTRRAITFDAPEGLNGYTVFMQGEALIDSLTVADAARGSDYATAIRNEVALAPDGGEHSAMRLQFIDESPRVSYRVTGAYTPDTVLKGKVVDVYGEERPLPDIKVSENPSGSFDYLLSREKGLGSFRIETWVEEKGRRTSPYSELIMTRIRRPVYENRDAPNSPFGNHVNPSQPRLSLLKAAGVNHIRLHDCFWRPTCWADVEPEKGKWTINDAGIDEYRRAHMLVLGWLGGVPKWAAPPNSKKDYYGWGEGWGGYYSLVDEGAYRNYVRQIVTHYRGRIREWHLWNEPWFVPQGAEKFARLQKIAYEEMKKAAPEVELIGFNTVADYGNTPDWTSKIYHFGGYQTCDSMDYHIYEASFLGYPGDTIERSFKAAWDGVLKQEKGAIKPIYMSEGNWNGNRTDGAGMYNHSITWKGLENSLETSNGLVRFHLALFLAGCKRVYLYADQHQKYLLYRMGYPALLMNDGYPRPTFAAYSNMTQWLEDRTITRKTELAKGVWSIWFSGKGKTVAVITGKQSAEWSGAFPRGTTGFDLFGNPLQGKLEYRDLVFYLVVNDADKEQLPGGALYRP